MSDVDVFKLTTIVELLFAKEPERLLKITSKVELAEGFVNSTPVDK